MYRAKFRVLSRTEESTLRRGEDNVYRQSPAFTITMRPVSPRHQWNHQSDDVSVENSSFFEASPSGEFSMQLFPEEAEQFTVGQAVFVDFEPNPEGSWGFGALHIENGANVKLQLYRRSGSGSFHIGVQLPSTIEKLLNDCVGQARTLLERRTREGAGKQITVGPEMNWSLVLTPAPG